MIVEIFASCDENEYYSRNGINIKINRCLGQPEVEIIFVDDSEKQLFGVSMEWKQLKKIIERLEDSFK
jgi:hypothetical protein